MSYSSRIISLEENLKIMNAAMVKEKAAGNSSAITELSKKINDYETEIRRLNRLQFEDETQSVHQDDDR